MTKRVPPILALALIIATVAACGWNPKVKAVPITAPWDSMNLPIKQDAIVWASSEKQFKAVHKADKKEVVFKYVDALKNQGWSITKFDDKAEHNYFVSMEKGGTKLELEVYDFENTGVIIEKK